MSAALAAPLDPQAQLAHWIERLEALCDQGAWSEHAQLFAQAQAALSQAPADDRDLLLALGSCAVLAPTQAARPWTRRMSIGHSSNINAGSQVQTVVLPLGDFALVGALDADALARRGAFAELALGYQDVRWGADALVRVAPPGAADPAGLRLRAVRQMAGNAQRGVLGDVTFASEPDALHAGLGLIGFGSIAHRGSWAVRLDHQWLSIGEQTTGAQGSLRAFGPAPSPGSTWDLLFWVAHQQRRTRFLDPPDTTRIGARAALQWPLNEGVAAQLALEWQRRLDRSSALPGVFPIRDDRVAGLSLGLIWYPQSHHSVGLTWSHLRQNSTLPWHAIRAQTIRLEWQERF